MLNSEQSSDATTAAVLRGTTSCCSCFISSMWSTSLQIHSSHVTSSSVLLTQFGRPRSKRTRMQHRLSMACRSCGGNGEDSSLVTPVVCGTCSRRPPSSRRAKYLLPYAPHFAVGNETKVAHFFPRVVRSWFHLCRGEGRGGEVSCSLSSPLKKKYWCYGVCVESKQRTSRHNPGFRCLLQASPCAHCCRSHVQGKILAPLYE